MASVEAHTLLLGDVFKLHLCSKKVWLGSVRFICPASLQPCLLNRALFYIHIRGYRQPARSAQHLSFQVQSWSWSYLGDPWRPQQLLESNRGPGSLPRPWPRVYFLRTWIPQRCYYIPTLTTKEKHSILPGISNGWFSLMAKLSDGI